MRGSPDSASARFRVKKQMMQYIFYAKYILGEHCKGTFFCTTITSVFYFFNHVL